MGNFLKFGLVIERESKYHSPVLAVKIGWQKLLFGTRFEGNQ